ncbi:uncharacterized protein LOC143861308 [Tasmannia lanceolata]|uniref:uncharacterized protein LOC143861308 n=1 Tax=Tasmannia lanceolata TaxID=3420 RepID=UPI0040635CF1
MDLASGEDCLSKVVQQAVSSFPGAGIDYMVHNAAYERPKTTALDVTEEALKATFDINVLGTISLTRLLAPFMLRRGAGHFIVMSSAAGKTPAPGQAVYSASKYAVNGYFHSLRSELCKKGIKVTVVCPGPIETSNGTGASSSEQSASSGKRVTSERCADLTIIAATHGLKEVWISNQPVLAVMYLVQYMPTIGYWLMDKGHEYKPAVEKARHTKRKKEWEEVDWCHKRNQSLSQKSKTQSQRRSSKEIRGSVAAGYLPLNLDVKNSSYSAQEITREFPCSACRDDVALSSQLQQLKHDWHIKKAVTPYADHSNIRQSDPPGLHIAVSAKAGSTTTSPTAFP